MEKTQNSASEERSSFQDKVSRYIEDLQDSIKTRAKNDWSAYDIADQAFDAMQSTSARQKLAAYPPDINIEIARNACGTLEFDRAGEMIELGRVKTREKLALTSV